VRRFFQRLPVTARPALHEPAAYLVMFTLPEMIALAQAQYWPLPA
jgi:hypothetical protein